MQAISNSHGAGKFGPNKRQRETSNIEWFSMRFYTKNGEKVPGVCRVHKDHLHECAVELGVGSFEDLDNKTPARTVRVPYTIDRALLKDYWDALIREYDEE